MPRNWISVVDAQRPKVGAVVETCAWPSSLSTTYYRKYMKDRCDETPDGRWSDAFDSIEAASCVSRPARRMSSQPTYWRPV